MRSCALLFWPLLLRAILAGCSGWTEMWESVPLVRENQYSLCAAIHGTVLDSVTDQPLEGVRVKVIRHSQPRCVSSTNSKGTYECRRIRLTFSSSPDEISALRKNPPVRWELDLKIVFEKPGYRAQEISLPVEFAYCSRHPQGMRVRKTKAPPVLLVRE
jgi:hypothetical protein